MKTCVFRCLEWGHAHGKISEDTYENAVSELVQTADNMPVIIQDADTWIQKNGEIMAKAHDIRVMGTKDIFGIVLEGSLKLVETLRVPVSGYEFEEFIHGIYNAINEDSVLIILSLAANRLLLHNEQSKYRLPLRSTLLLYRLSRT